MNTEKHLLGHGPWTQRTDTFFKWLFVEHSVGLKFKSKVGSKVEVKMYDNICEGVLTDISHLFLYHEFCDEKLGKWLEVIIFCK